MPSDTQEDMLTKSTLETIQRFNDAFSRHDVEAVMAAMTEDCVFENTTCRPARRAARLNSPKSLSCGARR